MDLIDTDALLWASLALLSLGVALWSAGKYFDWLLTDWEDRWSTQRETKP